MDIFSQFSTSSHLPRACQLKAAMFRASLGGGALLWFTVLVGGLGLSSPDSPSFLSAQAAISSVCCSLVTSWLLSL